MIYVVIDPTDSAFMFVNTDSRGQIIAVNVQPSGHWHTNATMLSIADNRWEPGNEPEHIRILKARQPQWIFIKSPKLPLNLHYPEYFI